MWTLLHSFDGDCYLVLQDRNPKDSSTFPKLTEIYEFAGSAGLQWYNDFLPIEPVDNASVTMGIAAALYGIAQYECTCSLTRIRNLLDLLQRLADQFSETGGVELCDAFVDAVNSFEFLLAVQNRELNYRLLGAG